MQIKSIRKNIENKMEEWLATIPNIEKVDSNYVPEYLITLRDRVRKNLLVSGGSIASMLLKEDVNDYDVYIQDMDVLIDLVRYYTKGYPDIRVLDGRKRNEYLSELHPNQQGIVYVSINNLKTDQVKLYFESESGGKKIDENYVNKDSPQYLPTFFSPNAISLSNKIQIVTRFHGDNEAIHKTFDFIHATNYFTMKDGLVTNKEALESIICKQLKYQGSFYPLTSIIRMKKFIKRGWNMNAGEILKIMFQISELDLHNPNILEEQLIGVDVAYFGRLIEILRTVDANKITSPYLNTLIYKIFNDYDEGNV